MTKEQAVELWDAIREYGEACDTPERVMDRDEWISRAHEDLKAIFIKYTGHEVE